MKTNGVPNTISRSCNKRVAFLAAGLFLEPNGFRLAATHVDATRTVLALAAGEMKEEEFAAWIRDHTKRLARPDQAGQ